ncbi:hypothetical protein BT69DRAFT_1289466 [Atractiella rhizophila]|nr:hypothetical protein BT69DRAFT_1289466 [Atractiella rhizophila]
MPPKRSLSPRGAAEAGPSKRIRLSPAILTPPASQYQQEVLPANDQAQSQVGLTSVASGSGLVNEVENGKGKGRTEQDDVDGNIGQGVEEVEGGTGESLSMASFVPPSSSWTGMQATPLPPPPPDRSITASRTPLEGREEEGEGTMDPWDIRTLTALPRNLELERQLEEMEEYERAARSPPSPSVHPHPLRGEEGREVSEEADEIEEEPPSLSLPLPLGPEDPPVTLNPYHLQTFFQSENNGGHRGAENLPFYAVPHLATQAGSELHIGNAEAGRRDVVPALHVGEGRGGAPVYEIEDELFGGEEEDEEDGEGSQETHSDLVEQLMEDRERMTRPRPGRRGVDMGEWREEEERLRRAIVTEFERSHPPPIPYPPTESGGARITEVIDLTSDTSSPPRRLSFHLTLPLPNPSFGSNNATNGTNSHSRSDVGQEEDDDDEIQFISSTGPTRGPSTFDGGEEEDEEDEDEIQVIFPPPRSPSPPAAFKNPSERKGWEELTCPICLCPPKPLVTTSCGHTFCGPCLHAALLAQPKVQVNEPSTGRFNFFSFGFGGRTVTRFADEEGVCPVCRTELRGGWGHALRGIYLRMGDGKGRKADRELGREDPRIEKPPVLNPEGEGGEVANLPVEKEKENGGEE